MKLSLIFLIELQNKSHDSLKSWLYYLVSVIYFLMYGVKAYFDFTAITSAILAKTNFGTSIL